MHDKKNNFICPIAEFFSTGHDSKIIASYFLLIKDELERYMSKRSFQCAPIIVTDFSWGLINAVMRTFNNCSFEIYINWCADLLINKNIWNIHQMPTIHVLCYSHFIKMTAKKIKKINKFNARKNNQKLHTVAMYACAILQKSQSIEDFSKNLKYCFNIFYTKYDSDVKFASLKAIKEKIINGSFDNDFDFKESLKIEEKKAKKKILYSENRNLKSFKKNSPFTNYFTKVINHHKKNIHKKTKKCGKGVYKYLNKYYCPEIFKILFQYVHLMPMWSNALLVIWATYYQIDINRLTNNPAENWFHQVKDSLKMFLPVMPSEFANVVYSIIEAYYYQNTALEKIKLVKNIDFNKESHENWSKSRFESKRREKNFYDKLKITNGKHVFDNKFNSN